MGALSALRTTGGALSRNPVVFAGTFIVALFGVVALSLWFAAQILSAQLIGLVVILLVSVAFFFVSPFLLGGVLGMASEAVSGRTSLGTFVRVGKARYVTLLLANLLYALLASALYIVFFIIGAIVALVVFGVALAGSGGDGHLGIAALAIFALVILVLYLLFLLFIFFVQFFSVAVVVDEAGVTESFSRSYRLVRRNILSTLGYMVLRFLVGLAIVIPFVIVLGLVVVFATGGLSTVPPPTAPGTSSFDGFGLSVAVLVAIAVGFLVLQTISSAVMNTYAVAFYRDRRAPDENESQSQQGPNQQPSD